MKIGTDRILVMGATGRQGGHTARELLAAGHSVRVMTRKPEGPEAQALAARGAEVVAVERALAGMWGAFAVQNTWEAGVEREEQQGLRTAELARRQGIQHLVYTSVGSAHRNTGIPHFENKWRVEERIRALGFPSQVVLRPVFFMENFASPWFLPALEQGQLTIGIDPATRLQMITTPDIGKYARWAFENHAALNGRAIDLAGDELTMPEAAAVLGRAMGRTVEFVPTPIEQVRSYSPDFAAMLEWFDRTGYEADIEATAKESGVRPTRFAEWAASVTWPARPHADPDAGRPAPPGAFRSHPDLPPFHRPPFRG